MIDRLMPSRAEPTAAGLGSGIATALALGAFAGLLFATASAGILLSRETGGIAPIWLANAISISILHRRARGDLATWSLTGFVAILLANLVTGVAPALSVAFSTINLAEIVSITAAMRHFAVDSERPARSIWMVAVAVVSVAIGALAAGTIVDALTGDGVLAVAETWLPADLLGLLIIVPALTAITRTRTAPLARPRQIALVALVVTITAVVTTLVFSQQRYPLLFLIAPSLVFAAFALGFVGATITNLTVVVIAIVLTATGRGPIAGDLPDFGDRMLLLQVFLAVNALLVLPIASFLEQRREALTRLRSSEKLHQLLSENGHDLVGRTDLDGVRLYISPVSERILGYRPDELVGENAITPIHPDDRTRVWEVHRMLLAGAVNPMCIYRQRHKDGHYVWLEAVYRLVSDADSGEPIEFVASERDITQRRDAERSATEIAGQLQESNRLLTMAEAVARVGHWRIDKATGTVFWSDEVYRIHGQPPSYVPSVKTAIKHYHPDDADRVAKVVGGSLETGDPYYLDARIRHLDGTVRWVATTGQAERAPNGDIVGLFGVIQDTTAQVEARRELVEAREAAERALAAKSSFTATISHEIRTPLTGVLSVIDLLRDADTEADRARYMTALERSATLLSTIVDDVLVFSTLDEGKVALEAVPFDLRVLVDDIAGAFEREAVAKGLTLSCAMPQDAAAFVIGDPTRIKRVLANLLSNAIKFTATGGVTISVQPVAPAHWRFAVVDTGIGISAGRLDDIFEPFVQADASITRSFGGTGLGLSICRMLVTAMGGAIAVDSRPGGGSAFSFVLDLPPAEPTAVAKDEAEATVAPTRRLDILIADDNDTNRFLIAEVVRRLGHTVTSVADGAKAVAAVTARGAASFDLILMDVQMPVLDGIAATRAIRGWAGAGAATPIHALTADVTPERRRALIDAGMNGVLAKPIRPDLLKQVLAACADTGTDEESIDRERLIGFDVQLGRDARNMLLALLIEDAGRSPRTIRSMAEARRFDLVGLEAHSLRGAAASVGARRLVAVLAQVEDAAKAKAVEEALLETLEAAARDVVTAANAALQAVAAT